MVSCYAAACTLIYNRSGICTCGCVTSHHVQPASSIQHAAAGMTARLSCDVICAGHVQLAFAGRPCCIHGLKSDSAYPLLSFIRSSSTTHKRFRKRPLWGRSFLPQPSAYSQGRSRQPRSLRQPTRWSRAVAAMRVKAAGDALKCCLGYHA